MRFMTLLTYMFIRRAVVRSWRERKRRREMAILYGDMDFSTEPAAEGNGCTAYDNLVRALNGTPVRDEGELFNWKG